MSFEWSWTAFGILIASAIVGIAFGYFAKHHSDVSNALIQAANERDYWIGIAQERGKALASLRIIGLEVNEMQVWDHIKRSSFFEKKGKPALGADGRFQLLRGVVCLGYPIEVFINYRPLPVGLLYTGQDTHTDEYTVAANKEGEGRICVIIENEEEADELKAISVMDGLKQEIWGEFAHQVEFIPNEKILS
ncbi:MAG: hypothetical protein ACW99U_12945 [Candidatus Thorarchaeota archaeon]|jgi:hypothetical protein